MSEEKPVEGNPNNPNQGEPKIEEFPLCNWKMRSIFDERDKGEEYWAAIFDRRTGRTGQYESELN